MKKLMAYILPLIPLAMGIISNVRGRYGFKITVALQLTCLVITAGMILWNRSSRRSDWLLPLAYVWCICGDSFLFHRGNSDLLFVFGIAFFALMHLNYFILMRCNGKINKWFGIIFTSLLLVYFAIFLLPLEGMGLSLKIAVLIYLLLSCLTLSTAIGLRLAKPEKTVFICAIALMIFSDTTISFKEFIHWEKLNFLLMPTYYYSLIFMCTAMCLKLSRTPHKLPVDGNLFATVGTTGKDNIDSGSVEIINNDLA